MRNLKIWGAVAVLAVLLATVAVFGSIDSAQAGDLNEPLNVDVSNSVTGGLGFADNELLIDWDEPNNCGNCEGYNVAINICSGPDESGRCKRDKVSVVGVTELTYFVVDMKGFNSIQDGDEITVHVSVKHEPGTDNNGGHDIGTDTDDIDEGA